MTDNGFGHVSQQFVEEEIEVRQIPPSQTSPSPHQRRPLPQRRRLASPPGEDDGHDQLHAHRFW